jgi:integrase
VAGVTWNRTRTPGVYVREGVRGKHYRVVYRDGSGRQVAKNFDRLMDAETFKRSVALDRPEDHAAGRITLRAVYDEMVKAHESDGVSYADATLKLHEQAWKHLAPLADKEVRRITPSSVTATLRAIPGPAMRDKTRKMLSTVCAFAVERRYLTTSPVRVTRKRTTRAARLRRGAAATRPRIPDDDELTLLLTEIPERYRALVELMAYAGLRPGEAVALTVGKLDPLHRTLTVDTSLTGFTKTGEPRTLVLPAVVVEMLVEHLARFSDPTDPTAPMFPKEDGAAIDSKNAYDAWSRRHFRAAAKRARINHGLRPNDCRHMAAARAVASGADVYVVQKMLGHAKPSITLDVYGFLWKGSLEAVVEQLDEAIRAARVKHQLAEVVQL